jgi:hypothetical protein
MGFIFKSWFEDLAREFAMFFCGVWLVARWMVVREWRNHKIR